MADTTAFDAATTVRPTGEPGRYTTDVDGDWSIEGRPNGGYLLALLTRAAMLEVADGHEEPLAASATFVTVTPPGPAEIEVEVLRHGRGSSVVRARLTAAGAVCVEALVTAGSYGADVLHETVPCPPMPPERDCPRAPVQAGPFRVPLLGPVCERFDLATAGFALGRPAGAGELRAWVSFDDGRDADPLALLLFADCLAPPTFDLPQVGLGWTPTLQLGVHLLAAAAPGPVIVRSVARSVTSGVLDETCDLWDSTGRHVAVARQLAGVRPAG